jgi:seryl-tRNA(Sec) selenium transferase
MKFPNQFRQFLPTEAVKQVSQFIGNPKLADALRDAAEKAGFKDTFTHSSLQPIQQVFENASRWMENFSKQFTDGSPHDFAGAGINATGELFSPRWLGLPLSPQQSWMLSGSIRGTIDSTHVSQELTRLVLSKTGAQEVIFVNSMAAGLATVASSTNRIESQTKWILPRQNCIRIPRFGDSSVASIRDILDDSRINVVEVGTNQDCDVEELDKVVGNGSAFAVSLSIDGQTISTQAVDGTISTRNALRSARVKNNLHLVELVLDGTMQDLRDKLNIGTCLSKLWDDGIDIAIVPCEFFIGSSEGCMILFRDHSAIAGASRERVNRNGVELSIASKLLLLSLLRASSSYEEWEQTELGQILATSSQNLLQRAQRMATQLNGSPLLKSAEANSRACRLGAGVWASTQLESGCVRLYPKTGDTKELAASLLTGQRPIWCNVTPDYVEIVLRTMSPDDDLELIQRLCENRPETDVRTDNES